MLAVSDAGIGWRVLQHCPASESLPNFSVIPISFDRVRRDKEFVDLLEKQRVADVIQFLPY